MRPFDSKQFEVKREDQAIATWKGPKDRETVKRLIDLVLDEKWRGEFVLSLPGNGGINSIVVTERKMRRIVEEREDTPY